MRWIKCFPLVRCEKQLYSLSELKSYFHFPSTQALMVLCLGESGCHVRSQTTFFSCFWCITSFKSEFNSEKKKQVHLQCTKSLHGCSEHCHLYWNVATKQISTGGWARCYAIEPTWSLTDGLPLQCSSFIQKFSVCGFPWDDTLLLFSVLHSHKLNISWFWPDGPDQTTHLNMALYTLGNWDKYVPLCSDVLNIKIWANTK